MEHEGSDAVLSLSGTHQCSWIGLEPTQSWQACEGFSLNGALSIGKRCTSRHEEALYCDTVCCFFPRCIALQHARNDIPWQYGLNLSLSRRL